MAAAESADALVAAAGLLCAVGRAMVELDATLTPTLNPDPNPNVRYPNRDPNPNPNPN